MTALDRWRGSRRTPALLRDEATGVASAEHFHQRLDATAARAHRRNDTIAVLILAVDMGRHPEVLRAVAQRLQVHARQEDTVARLGPDEFAVLLDEVVDETAAARVAGRISAELTRPLSVEGKAVRLHAALGVAAARGSHVVPVDLVEQARRARRAAGPDGWRLVDAARDAMARARLRREEQLEQAAAEGRLHVWYLPQVELATGTVVGVEAQLRWADPQRGETVLAPLEHVGSYLLEEACRAAARLGARAPVLTVPMAGRAISAPSLVLDVLDVLQRTGLPAQLLTLGLSGVPGSEEVRAALLRLRAHGVGLALDAELNLGALRALPVSGLVLGRGVLDEVTEPAVAAGVRAVHAATTHLGLSLVATDVDSPDQLLAVRALGLPVAQGLALGAPMSALAIVGRAATRVRQPLPHQ